MLSWMIQSNTTEGVARGIITPPDQMTGKEGDHDALRVGRAGICFSNSAGYKPQHSKEGPANHC